MQVLLLKVPPCLGEELERRIPRESGQDPRCQLLHVPSLESLPNELPPGLVVLADPAGPLDELVELCRQVDGRRSSSSRTWLIVLTQRGAAALEALARAGADECAAPPGENWGVRLLALQRRLSREGTQEALRARLELRRLSHQELLHVLLSSTSAEIGHDFFRPLVEQLASAFRVDSAMVLALSEDGETLRALALWVDGSFEEGLTWPLRGTPHEQAITHGARHLIDELGARFPEDAISRRLGLRGYLGVALKDSRQKAMGVLAVAHREPLDAGATDYALLGALGARAGAELARISAQAELERTRDFLRNTLNAVPDPVFVKDRAHRWVAMNAAFCRVIGRPEEELVGKSDEDFFSASEVEAFWKEDEEVFQSGEPRESEERRTDSAGNSLVFVTKKALFLGSGGEPFVVGVNRDVTESRRLEMQLRLADRMASVGTLAAGVAHEINNPLAYISSNLTFIAEQLAQEELTAAQRSELREATMESLEGAARVRIIVQDLKAFARADDEAQGAVDVTRVIHGSLRLVRNEFQHRARLVRALEPVPPIRGNEARLGQVLVNLLVNALHALPAERPSEQNVIRISTQSRGEWVHVEVEDNGQGMTPEVQRRIFEPFFTTKPVGIGTGLGLSICNNLIQIMGGWIDVSSKPGEGSTFRLVLPAFLEQSQALASSPRAEEEAGRPRRRVLLIDDEPAVGSAVRRLLRELHEVYILQDAREALQRIASGERYDAIVCDVMMQEMSGVQFLQELERSAPELARRTGLMSGGVFDPQAREFIESRAIDFLQKPFEREGLRKFVERLLG